MTSRESFVRFYELAVLQILFNINVWELIFIDEFIVDSRKYIFKGWTKSEIKALFIIFRRIIF